MRVSGLNGLLFLASLAVCIGTAVVPTRTGFVPSFSPRTCAGRPMKGRRCSPLSRISPKPQARRRAGWTMMSDRETTTSPTGVPSSLLRRGIQLLIKGRGGESQKEQEAVISSLPNLSTMMDAMVSGSMEELLQKPLPHHPLMKTGALPNGLQYIILPNASPPERFEAHLEVFAGSADELDRQQGMAHLVEHIAYMGSRKRERLFGTGSQTNAYTDFHHTVFYASCPVLTPPGWGRRVSMLPRALEALCDVLEAKCEPSRLEKERAAVLSEMTMVNTIDYRVECQILSALHAENMLSRRFPIGKEELIKSWQPDDIREFHATHYRPNNALLYVVGDVNIDACEEQIRKVFGHLAPGDMDRYAKTLKHESRHFPPVTHKWSGGFVSEENTLPILPSFDALPLGAPRIFKHDLLQAFSLHAFAKRPIEPIRNLGDFRRAVMKRIALAALQIRLSVNSRSDPPFTMIEFNQLDSPREACAVCYLDMTAEPAKWKDAVKLAIKEIRRLGMYGLTSGELARFGSALLTDAQQLAAQGDRVSNSEQLTFLMDSVASGHMFMDARQTYEASRLVVESITLEEVNAVALEVCEHMMLLHDPAAPQPSAIVACVPGSASVGGDMVKITEADLLDVIKEGAEEEVHASTEVAVPVTLFSPEEIIKLDSSGGSWVPFIPKESARGGLSLADTPPAQPVLSVDDVTGVVQRRLSNGVRVNLKTSPHESQRAQMRLTFPGGRQFEDTFGVGSVAVGARTMQEGGAFEGWEREDVELFCIDHLVMVSVDANEEYLTMDLSFPTTKLHAREGAVDNGEISGTEAAFQVVNKILAAFVWEEDALNRAKQAFLQAHEAMIKSLEGTSTEQLMGKICGGDSRFMSVPHEGVRALTLDQVKTAVMAQMTTDVCEVSLAGDFDIQEAENMFLRYVGSVPSTSRKEPAMPVRADVPLAPKGSKDRHVDVHLSDSDDRAVAYVAGVTPNRWGVMVGGETVANHLKTQENAGALGALTAAVRETATNSESRRGHPLFAFVALALLKEVINRRLFSTVREQKRLTYDANFHLTSFERHQGSWYLITVTASPANAEAALQACKDTMYDLVSNQPITFDNVESAKRVLINRHENEMRTNSYWCELLSGVQGSCVPEKDVSCIRDFAKVINTVGPQDLQMLLSTLTVDASEMYTCIGISGTATSSQPPQ